MKLLSLSPMLRTEKMEETIQFYIENLGFKCVEKSENPGWAVLIKDDVEIMLAKPNDHIPFSGPVFSGSLYINTDMVNILWESLKDSVTIVYPIENFDYGKREFAIYDNNGYILQFGQNI